MSSRITLPAAFALSTLTMVCACTPVTILLRLLPVRASEQGNVREYGSTLYVGLARAVSPTNTNFRLTFLLTRLQEALYEDLAV